MLRLTASGSRLQPGHLSAVWPDARYSPSLGAATCPQSRDNDPSMCGRVRTLLVTVEAPSPPFLPLQQSCSRGTPARRASTYYVHSTEQVLRQSGGALGQLWGLCWGLRATREPGRD